PVEAQIWELREAEQRRQRVVGALFPTGRPEELELLGEAPEALPRRQRDAVDHPVDELELGLLAVRRLIEAEEADHPVDVDGEKRFGRHGMSLRGSRTATGGRLAVCTMRRRA